MIIDILFYGGYVGALACLTGPDIYRRLTYKPVPELQEFSSRQVKLVAELLKERTGWNNLERGMDPIHDSGVRYFPCNNGSSFYTVMDDYGVWVDGDTLSAFDRRELQRLYKALAQEVKNERQSELTRTLARRVVSGERVEAEPVGAQLDPESVKSIGFNPLAGTKWEDTYASAGISAYNSAGQLMLECSGYVMKDVLKDIQKKALEIARPSTLEERIRTGEYRDQEEYEMYDPDVQAWKAGKPNPPENQIIRM